MLHKCKLPSVRDSSLFRGLQLWEHTHNQVNRTDVKHVQPFATQNGVTKMYSITRVLQDLHVWWGEEACHGQWIPNITKSHTEIKLHVDYVHVTVANNLCYRFSELTSEKGSCADHLNTRCTTKCWLCRSLFIPHRSCSLSVR